MFLIQEYDDKKPLLKYEYTENSLRNNEKLGYKKVINENNIF